jgi:hypothetical protein
MLGLASFIPKLSSTDARSLMEPLNAVCAVINEARGRTRVESSGPITRESGWFQPSNPQCDILVSKLAFKRSPSLTAPGGFNP